MHSDTQSNTRITRIERARAKRKFSHNFNKKIFKLKKKYFIINYYDNSEKVLQRFKENPKSRCEMN